MPRTISKYLATYLNDHLAGSTAGLELARRAAGGHEGSELGTFLTRLAEEIEEDRRALQDFMAALGAGEDRLKVAAGWAGEKLGRLKPNGHILSASPLSPLVELEGLSLGVEGKRLLWVTLRDVLEGDPLSTERLDELISRAERQRAELETHRIAVARAALR